MTESKQEHSLVAMYDSHTGAEAAVKALLKAGVDMRQLSIVARDFHTEEHAMGFYTTGDRIKMWGGRGAFWGSLWGMLFGGAFFFIPGIGPLVIMGPMVATVVGALEGAALGGAGGVLAAALTAIGVPSDSVVKYELEVKSGKFLVLANGSADMIEKARIILGATGASHLTGHARAKSAFTTRESILQLLSNDEVARVSTAESAHRLADGDEYLDLEQLDQGVRRANGGTASLSSLLPRKSVRDDTWKKIQEQLDR